MSDPAQGRPDPAQGLAVHTDAAPCPAPYRKRHDGWTAARRGKFLRALAETGCVRDACRMAGISSTSAYRMRARDEGFAAEWDSALDEAAPGLEAAAYKRAVEGVEEPIVSGGKVIGSRTKYSDALLRTLLLRGDNRAEAAERLAGHPDYLSTQEIREGWSFDSQGRKFREGTPEEIRARLEAKLDEMAQRLLADERGEGGA